MRNLVDPQELRGARTVSEAPRTASTRQTLANSRNSLKSTGPKTQAGKKRSRMNAVKHGLCASMLTAKDYGKVIGAEEVEAFVTQVREEYAPRTRLEATQLDVIILCMFKLQLAMKLDATSFATQLPKIDGDPVVTQKGQFSRLRLDQLDSQEKGWRELQQALREKRGPDLSEVPRDFVRNLVEHLLEDSAQRAFVKRERQALIETRGRYHERSRKPPGETSKDVQKKAEEEMAALAQQIASRSETLDNLIKGIVIKKNRRKLLRVEDCQQAITQLMNPADLPAEVREEWIGLIQEMIDKPYYGLDREALEPYRKLALEKVERYLQQAAKTPDSICCWSRYIREIQCELQRAVKTYESICSLTHF